MHSTIIFIAVLSIACSQNCILGAPCTQGQPNCVEQCGIGYEGTSRTLKCSPENKWVVESGACTLVAPSSFNYSQTTLELFKDVPMTPLPANYIGAELTFDVKDSDLGYALPEGLFIDKNNGTIYGTPTKEQERESYTLRCRNIRGDLYTTIQISVKIQNTVLTKGENCGLFGLVERRSNSSYFARSTMVKMHRKQKETSPYSIEYTITEFSNPEYTYLVKREVVLEYVSSEKEKETYRITSYNVTLSKEGIQQYSCIRVLPEESVPAEYDHIEIVLFMNSSADCIDNGVRIFYEEYQKWVGNEVLVNVYTTGIQSELFDTTFLPRLTNDGCDEITKTDTMDIELYTQIMNTLVMVLVCVCGVLLIIILVLSIIISVMKKKKSRTMRAVNKVEL